MEPEAGDDLVVDAASSEGGARVGRILAVQDRNGHSVYLVHWVAGDYDALVSAWPGVRIQHREHQPAASKQADSGLSSAASARSA